VRGATTTEDAVATRHDAAPLGKTWRGAVSDPVGGSPQQTAEYVKAELLKYRKVVHETGAKPD
jgi:hypothetical protein